jgi:hypothetical protein
MEAALPRSSPDSSLSNLSQPDAKTILASGFEKTESFVALRGNFTET